MGETVDVDQACRVGGKCVVAQTGRQARKFTLSVNRRELILHRVNAQEGFKPAVLALAAVYIAFNETFAASGLGWVWDRPLYKRLLDVTGGKERLRHYIDGWSPPGGAEAIARIPALHADKTARYIQIGDPLYKRTMTYRVIAMVDLLRFLKAGSDDSVQARVVDDFSVAIRRRS